jgi:hypothetical protein
MHTYDKHILSLTPTYVSVINYHEICALLGCNAASNGNPLPRAVFPPAPEVQFETPSLSFAGASPLSVPHSLRCPRPRRSLHKPRVSLAGFLFFLDFLTLEDGKDTLYRNVGKGLQLDAAFTPEERTSYQHRRGSMKSRITCHVQGVSKSQVLLHPVTTWFHF